MLEYELTSHKPCVLGTFLVDSCQKADDRRFTSHCVSCVGQPKGIAGTGGTAITVGQEIAAERREMPRSVSVEVVKSQCET